MFHECVEQAHKHLKELAQLVCAKASDTALLLLRAINHTILLINDGKVYPWRPSRCPKPLRPHWAEKQKSYLASGRWQMTSTGNTVPMLFMKKPGMDQLQTVVDLRA